MTQALEIADMDVACIKRLNTSRICKIKRIFNSVLKHQELYFWSHYKRVYNVFAKSENNDHSPNIVTS